MLAGPLREVFAVDVTDGRRPVRGLRATVTVASAARLRRRAGLVAPLPRLRAVVLRLVRGPGAAWLDLRGVASLRIPMTT